MRTECTGVAAGLQRTDHVCEPREGGKDGGEGNEIGGVLAAPPECFPGIGLRCESHRIQ